MITTRDFLLRDNYFCEKYSMPLLLLRDQEEEKLLMNISILIRGNQCHKIVITLNSVIKHFALYTSHINNCRAK